METSGVCKGYGKSVCSYKIWVLEIQRLIKDIEEVNIVFVSDLCNKQKIKNLNCFSILTNKNVFTNYVKSGGGGGEKK